MCVCVCVCVQCCFLGQVYRDAVRIQNRASSAMKATLTLPPSVHPFLQAHPTTGFCQVSTKVRSVYYMVFTGPAPKSKLYMM